MLAAVDRGEEKITLCELAMVMVTKWLAKTILTADRRGVGPAELDRRVRWGGGGVGRGV